MPYNPHRKTVLIAQSLNCSEAANPEQSFPEDNLPSQPTLIGSVVVSESAEISNTQGIPFTDMIPEPLLIVLDGLLAQRKLTDMPSLTMNQWSEIHRLSETHALKAPNPRVRQTRKSVAVRRLIQEATGWE